MNKCFQYSLSIIFITAILSCKSVCKYTIDDEPKIKIDTNLLGIWKLAEDTDKANFILIQNQYDVFKAKRIFDQDQPRYDNYKYYITYMDRHGRNPHYQQFQTFLSQVKGRKFLNIGQLNSSLDGYFFVKILNVNDTRNKVTIAVVADSSLNLIKSSSELRKRIEKNINRPFFYCDTLHFYKVNNFHSDLNKSTLFAN